MRALRLLAFAGLLALAGPFALAGCDGGAGSPSADSVVPSGPRCIERVPAGVGASGRTESGSAFPALPAMALQCFDGGRWTDLADLGGMPTVVNLWASWCPPCRAELPAVQRFAVDGAGRVRVVGVVSKDRHDQAQSVIDDAKLTFPMLEDQRQLLAIAVSPLVSKALVTLPSTIFVTADGRIAYAYQGDPLTDARLRELTRQYLGVEVGR
jgi:thiol-disulfide isomerase/thioredoxin